MSELPESANHVARSSSFQPGMWNWTEQDWFHGRPEYNLSSAHGWYAGGHGGSYTVRYVGGHGGGYASGHVFGHADRCGRSTYGVSNRQGRKQRKQTEKEFSYYCDTCDRGFKTQDKYQEHVSQHVQCSVSGCSFTGHEKLVSIHWKNCHGPGSKQFKLDTAEEIARWREERRRNYPTLYNVQKKQKVVERREEAGAVLDTAQFGRMRGRGHAAARREPGSTEDPLGVLIRGENDSDKEDSADGLIVAPKRLSSALGSLMASYDSSGESEGDEAPPTGRVQDQHSSQTRTPPVQAQRTPVQAQRTPVQAQRTPVQTQRTPVQAQRTPVQTQRTPVQAQRTPVQTQRTPVQAQRTPVQTQWTPVQAQRTPVQTQRKVAAKPATGKWGRRQHADPLRKPRPSLLEMLLAPDIRHERNVLLQCVRYVVRNRFFGLDPQDQIQSACTDQDHVLPRSTAERNLHLDSHTEDPEDQEDLRSSHADDDEMWDC